MSTVTVDHVARALADPTRREILRVVRDEERTVSDIAARFPVTRPAVSQHLRILLDAELVGLRVDGRRNWYRARPGGLGELRDWMDSFWNRALDRLQHEVETEMEATPPR